MTALAMSSLAASTPSTLPPAAVSAWVKVGAAFATTQPLTTDSETIVSLPADCSGSSTACGALREEHRVVVDVGAAVHHDDLRVVDVPLALRQSTRVWRLELADVLVVEGDVVRRGAAEVDAVVVDDLDAGLRRPAARRRHRRRRRSSR